VTVLIASAFYITKDNGIKSFIILEYVPNINNVNIISFDPAKSLIVLTVIYNAISELILSRSSSRMILYARRKR
jgi:hypothetical protein